MANPLSSSDRIEFERLTECLLAGTISDREMTRLDELQRRDAGLRDRYLQAVGVHLNLAQIASHPENRVVSDRDGLQDSFADRPPQSIAPPITPARRLRPILRWALAASAVLAMVSSAVIWFANRSPNESDVPQRGHAIAMPRISQASHAKIYGWGMAPRPGQGVDFHQELILTRGDLVVEFAAGARVVLSAPSVFSALAPERMLLTSGQCSVHAPPGAEGFRVETPTADVVDLGTRFAVSVGSGGATDVRVIDGAATVSPRSSELGASGPQSPTPVENSLLLRKGESASVDSDTISDEDAQRQGRLPLAMEVKFDQPIVNDLGPDVVLFDLHSLVNDEAGGRVRVHTRESFQRQQVLEIDQFDLDLSSPDALELTPYQLGISEVAIRDADQLLQVPIGTRRPNWIRSKGLATGIDLSDLGYEIGDTVSELSFQNYTDDGFGIDPVLIV